VISRHNSAVLTGAARKILAALIINGAPAVPLQWPARFHVLTFSGRAGLGALNFSATPVISRIPRVGDVSTSREDVLRWVLRGRGGRAGDIAAFARAVPNSELEASIRFARARARAGIKFMKAIASRVPEIYAPRRVAARRNRSLIRSRDFAIAIGDDPSEC